MKGRKKKPRRRPAVRKRTESGESAAKTRYSVHYPSGKTFTVEGRFALTPAPGSLNWILPVIITGDGPKDPVAVLDQRAIVTADGREIYSPRRIMDGLDISIREWLLENPEWAPLTS